MKVYDGENCVMGRLAAHAAKQLISGEEITVVNAEKLVITGRPEYTVSKYLQRRNLKQISKPENSPKTPRRPDLFFRKVVRGMLPWKSSRGKSALGRFRAYIGVPKEFEGKTEKIYELTDIHMKRMTVDELCKSIGWKG